MQSGSQLTQCVSLAPDDPSGITTSPTWKECAFNLFGKEFLPRGICWNCDFPLCGVSTCSRPLEVYYTHFNPQSADPTFWPRDARLRNLLGRIASLAKPTL